MTVMLIFGKSFAILKIPIAFSSVLNFVNCIASKNAKPGNKIVMLSLTSFLSVLSLLSPLLTKSLFKSFLKFLLDRKNLLLLIFYDLIS